MSASVNFDSGLVAIIRTKTTEEGRTFAKALVEAGQVLEWDATKHNEWNSPEEWNQDKPGYEWVFPVIDKDKDGKVSAAEYKEFQAFKQKHSDWKELYKAQLSGK